MPQVAGVEHSVVCHVVDGVAVGADVGVRAQQHAEVAVEGADFPNRLWPLVFEAKAFIGSLDGGHWQEGNQVGFDADRTGARTASTVRGGGGLVEGGGGD